MVSTQSDMYEALLLGIRPIVTKEIISMGTHARTQRRETKELKKKKRILNLQKDVHH